MKKIALILSIALTMTFASTTFADTTEQTEIEITDGIAMRATLKVALEGKELEHEDGKDEELSVLYYGSEYVASMYLPIESILDLLGATISWDEDNSNINTKTNDLAMGAFGLDIEEETEQVDIKTIKGITITKNGKDLGVEPYYTSFILYEDKLYASAWIMQEFADMYYVNESVETLKEATIDNEMEVRFNGKPVIFKDSKGNTLPVLENYDKYVPIRALANMAGKNIAWEPETKTVKIYGEIEAIINYAEEKNDAFEQSETVEVIESSNIKIEVDGKLKDIVNTIKYNGNIYISTIDIYELDIFSHIGAEYEEVEGAEIAFDIYNSPIATYKYKAENLLNRIEENMYYVSWNSENTAEEIDKALESVKSLNNIIVPKEVSSPERLKEELAKLESDMLSLQKLSIEVEKAYEIYNNDEGYKDKVYGEFKEAGEKYETKQYEISLRIQIIQVILDNLYKSEKEIQVIINDLEAQELSIDTMKVFYEDLQYITRYGDDVANDLEIYISTLEELKERGSESTNIKIDQFIQMAKGIMQKNEKINKYINDEIMLTGSELTSLRNSILIDMKTLGTFVAE